MEGFGSFGVSDKNSAVRKKRSNTSHRPRNDSQMPSDYRDISSLSSGENNGYASFSHKKEINLNQCSTRPLSINIAEVESCRNEDGGGFGESDEGSFNGSFRGSNEQVHSVVDSKRHSEGVLAPADWKGTSKMGLIGAVSDGLEYENKVKKVKIKVGGATRTIHAKSISDGASGVGSYSTKASRISDAPSLRPKLIGQDNSDENRSFTSDKGNGLRGVPWRDFSKYGFNVGKPDSSSSRIPEGNNSTNQADKYEPIRKSKRIFKRRVSIEALAAGDDDDDEIRYLEKLKTSKATSDYIVEDEDDEDGGSRKQRKISRVLKSNFDGRLNVDGGGDLSSRSGKEGKKTRSGRVFKDTDYVEEEEPISDSDTNTDKKKPKIEFADLLGDNKKEMTVTTRQQALRTVKDVSTSISASLIEFPNGLPPAPPRKQKEKLSEVEQQLKRAEALQRRRMQVEKAARESEAEAIRKILGQDSSRKKREDKVKKRQEELAQEKAANSMVLASDSVRWIMGPSGTVVTFPTNIGLPTIFDSKPCSYPPPREKCAGPSCTNPYKYRDSKSKLPLCSLQCYKAINEKMQPLTAW
ncbi:hypothetical protein I3843_07G029700 [Carya illinoinensis]|nr:hypothetical protein I3843_07G029700 [Carya illinoinensis]KAG7969412.1 hypothetical protein I3843_07G029700 [Carya illinoinensis]KAG7969413.1 hypothetical protein I3843_07G029700 [Carya illinoinensis]KAG7969414.1 hypothetical protein I3843_07G029700 [Carya illinoinensis]KAG7969415.1 hypothetical protein I3843_07G029700 [Carya illinoinensis]